MHTWIEINKSQLLQNFDTFASILGHDKVCPVVKSNAYGHGLEEVYSILSERSPHWLATNYHEEGVTLRKLGYKKHILNVGPTLPSDLPIAFEYNIETTIGNQSLLNTWLKLDNKPSIHIKIDTGMGRQGFLIEDIPSVIKQIKKHHKNIAGVSTHFSNVEDVLEFDYPKHQLELFQRAKTLFASAGFDIVSHAASSASSLILPESRFDLSRIGISMFAGWPSKMSRLSYIQHHSELASLQPILEWHCAVTNIKTVPKGSYIGYGCSFQTTNDMKIAVLPVGYYEGYPRVAGEHQSYVLIHGERCQIVGRICMNMMMVDVSHLAQININDKATLIGTSGPQYISPETFAAWSQTIHYEALTCLNSSIQRRVL